MYWSNVAICHLLLFGAGCLFVLEYVAQVGSKRGWKAIAVPCLCFDKHYGAESRNLALVARFNRKRNTLE
jgi:hypothetical protein